MLSWWRANRVAFARPQFVVPAAAVLVAAVLACALATGGADAGSGHGAACARPPAALVGSPDRANRSATMVYDASYLHMQVEGLDPWVRHVAERDGAPYADYVERCPRQLRRSSLVAAGVPAAARPALAAIRRYSTEMWNERSMASLLPALVRRSEVAGKPTWTFALVGPDSRTWRYAVVGDDARVVAWQLTGADAQRLFGTGPYGSDDGAGR